MLPQALLLKFVMEDSPLMLSVGHTGARVVSSSEATPITSTWTL